MELQELPGELAYFVQQALASGTYQSADELLGRHTTFHSLVSPCGAGTRPSKSN